MKVAGNARLAYQARPLNVQVNLSHCVLCLLTQKNVHTVVVRGKKDELNGNLVQPMEGLNLPFWIAVRATIFGLLAAFLLGRFSA